MFNNHQILLLSVFRRIFVITDVMVEFNETGKYREFDAFPETDSILKVNE